MKAGFLLEKMNDDEHNVNVYKSMMAGTLCNEMKARFLSICKIKDRDVRQKIMDFDMTDDTATVIGEGYYFSNDYAALYTRDEEGEGHHTYEWTIVPLSTNSLI